MAQPWNDPAYTNLAKFFLAYDERADKVYGGTRSKGNNLTAYYLYKNAAQYKWLNNMLKAMRLLNRNAIAVDFLVDTIFKEWPKLIFTFQFKHLTPHPKLCMDYAQHTPPSFTDCGKLAEFCVAVWKARRRGDMDYDACTFFDNDEDSVYIETKDLEDIHAFYVNYEELAHQASGERHEPPEMDKLLDKLERGLRNEDKRVTNVMDTIQFLQAHQYKIANYLEYSFNTWPAPTDVLPKHLKRQRGVAFPSIKKITLEIARKKYQRYVETTGYEQKAGRFQTLKTHQLLVVAASKSSLTQLANHHNISKVEMLRSAHQLWVLDPCILKYNQEFWDLESFYLEEFGLTCQGILDLRKEEGRWKGTPEELEEVKKKFYGDIQAYDSYFEDGYTSPFGDDDDS